MADLTLNFNDASFDRNSDNDFEISPGNDFIYEMGNPGNKIDTGISTGASITGAAFTIAHNQDFIFEFEDDGDATTTDDYKLTVFTQPSIAESKVALSSYSEDTVTFDVSQTDMDGVLGPDTISSPTLVEGRSAKVTETRLADPRYGGRSETDVYYVGDGEAPGYTSWVLSGDMNGTDGNDTSGDGTLGFHAGQYNGVFLGGAGFDTLVFEHDNSDDTAQMYVGLDSGFAMFGNGVSSPLVQFAEIGSQPYQLDWERLEMRGDSNDFVVVGGGLQGTDASVAARALDTSNFFQIDLGSGDDQLFVTDATQSITLDLSKTGNQSVTADSSGNEFTIDVSGNEMHDGHTGDSSSLSVQGSLDASGNDGVIDYIDFGDGQNNQVWNYSEQGLAVNFGSASDGSGNDSFTGSNRTDSDLIDLRGVDGELSIFDQGADASGSIISIDSSDNNIDIEATNVDLLYVSQLDASGNATADSDVLVNAEALYGSTGVLGQTLHDVNGDGYDVITSAVLEDWAGSAHQIYYDGDHNDFVDSGDALDRNASDYSVSMTSVATAGAGSEQLSWDNQVKSAAANNSSPEGSATPSFYIISDDGIYQRKVPVYLDETDPTAPQWKVDTSEFEVTSDAYASFSSGTPSMGPDSVQGIADKIQNAHGITVATSDLTAAKSVYLNGSHDDIVSLLALSDGSTLANMEMDAAYDFGFYTQVDGTKPLPGGGSETVAVNVALNHNWTGASDSWTLSGDDVHVQTSYNTVDTVDNAAVGGTGGDFVEMGGGAENVAMGNAGNDAYIVDASDNGLVNELGDLMGGGVSDADSVQFELVNDMHELDFTRIQIAGEKAGNTLQITASNGKGDATLFDQYNEFLSFRKTEYLVIDDGATADEVFELVTNVAMADASGNEWDNEIYVANSGGDSININEGGTDHVFLGNGADTVDLDGLSTGDSVTIHGISGSDTVNIGNNTADTYAAETIVVTKGSSLNMNHVDYYDASGGLLGDEDLAYQDTVFKLAMP